MGVEDSQNKLKLTAGDRLAKPLGLKKKNKKKNNNNNKAEHNEKKNSKLVESDENLFKLKEENRRNKSSGKKRKNRENINYDDVKEFCPLNIEDKLDEADGGKKKNKSLRNKKRTSDKIIEAEIGEVDEPYNEMEDSFDEQNGANEAGEKKRSKSRKNKGKGEKIKRAEIEKVDELHIEVEDCSDQQNGRLPPYSYQDHGKMEAVQAETQGQKKGSEGPGKLKKTRKIKKKDHLSSKKDEKLLENIGEAEEDEVYQISSGDEDCSRGMKKWIMENHQSRPGLKILQQRIDDFMTVHEAQEEQARKEREARAAEGGWTVVVHHKGRKKTTDSESGIAVGSVAQAAVLDNMAKKKSKEVGLDFYRFQKREAQRNEIMMLQSKFEQDKKRIQQLRAARKFRPY